MNQRVNEQMATCNHAEELAIDHMCDPCEWMPVPRVKGGKRPGESLERNTPIHHGIVLDIGRVIERDEAMPYQLRIDPKRYYRQTEQDEEVGSLECCSSACVSPATGRTRRGELAFARTEKAIFLRRCRDTPVFSILRSPFSHALCGEAKNLTEGSEGNKDFGTAFKKPFRYLHLTRESFRSFLLFTFFFAGHCWRIGQNFYRR